MYVLKATDVNHALSLGIDLIKEHGKPRNSRAGDVLEIPSPVATVYSMPWARVLINKDRDANPFFHLFESLWILAGRDDVSFLTYFNKRMGEYSDDGVIFNAPYGYRLRNGVNQQHDQIEAVIETLQNDPNSRQAVMQIWDDADLTKQTKDKACNMAAVFAIRENKLQMTVYNRSNDMIWGAYGANVVQFSMLMEYVAAHLDIPVGNYTQITNSYHVYTTGPGGQLWDKLKDTYKCNGIFERNGVNPYDEFDHTVRLYNSDVDLFDLDLECFFNIYDDYGMEALINEPESTWQSDYFRLLVIPMLNTIDTHKKQGAIKALTTIRHIRSDDWYMGVYYWLNNRVK